MGLCCVRYAESLVGNNLMTRTASLARATSCFAYRQLEDLGLQRSYLCLHLYIGCQGISKRLF